MEEMIEAKVNPRFVWELWEKAHMMHGDGAMEAGKKGRAKFRYQILDVKRGESFSILWKTLFVRLIFSHSVTASSKGSRICYKVQIKGPFALPVRWMLGAKIRNNMRLVLKAIVNELESKGVK